MYRGCRSAAPEQAFDIGEVERHIGRAPVITLAAVWRRFHLTQQRVHLGRREAAPSTHAGVAGKRAAHRLDALLQRERVTPFRELVGEVVYKGGDIDPGQ